MKRFLQMAREAFYLWEESRAATMGAALAYYTLFSIPPLLVIALAAASLVFGHEAATGELAAELKNIFRTSYVRPGLTRVWFQINTAQAQDC